MADKQVQALPEKLTEVVSGDKSIIIDSQDSNRAKIIDATRFKGDKGDQGDQGPIGNTGNTGNQGVQGIQGVAGSKGVKGDKGDTGATGSKGDTGAVSAVPGPKGEDGKSINPQGDWNNTANYDFLDLVEHMDATWLYVATGASVNEEPSDSNGFFWLKLGSTATGGGGPTINTTDDLPEGAINFYHTDARVNTLINNALAANPNNTILNNLTTTATGSSLDASQGKVLKDLIDAQQADITANNAKNSYPTADSNKVANIPADQGAINTNIEARTLANDAKTGITPAQVSDINANTAKRHDPATAGNNAIEVTGQAVGLKVSTTANNQASIDANGLFVAAAAPGAGEENVQSDFAQTDNTADDFIKNKPTTITPAQATAITANTAKVTYPTADANKVSNLPANQGAINTDIETRTGINDNKNSYPTSDATKLGDLPNNAGLTTSLATKANQSDLTAGLATKANNSITVTGTKSVTGGGDLTTNRTVELVGDAATPGNTKYYGTDATGTKGFFDLTGGIKNFVGSGAPTVSNDNTEGYEVLSRWLDTDTNIIYTLYNDGTGVAEWRVGVTSDNGVVLVGDEVITDPKSPEVIVKCYGDISTATYSGNSFNVSAQATDLESIAFSPDGLKLFLSGTGDIYEYTLGTSFDITTAVYSGNSKSFSSQTSEARGTHMSDDGTKIIIQSQTTIYEYTLTTGFDLSTMSYSGNSFATNTQDGNAFGSTLSVDGTRYYMSGVFTDRIYSYTMTTPYDLSTMSYDNASLDVSAQAGIPIAPFISGDGGTLIHGNLANNIIYEYTMTTPYNLTTASYTSNSFSHAAQFTDGPIDIKFSNDGNKMFLVGDTTSTSIFEYNVTPICS